MRVYLHSDRAEKSKSYLMTVAPAADSDYVMGEVPGAWMLSNGDAKQIEIVFSRGMAEVEDGLGVYLVKRGLAHRSRMVRSVRQFFDRMGKPIDEVFDENGVPVIYDLRLDAGAEHF